MAIEEWHGARVGSEREELLEEEKKLSSACYVP